MSLQPSIFADTESNPAVVFVRVEGRGTFQNGPGLRDFSVKMMDAGRREFVVDLKNCPAMDSTFMGILAGMAMRVDEAGGGSVWVINQGDRNRESLDGLGFQALFAEADAPSCDTPPGTALAPAADKATTREVMREAHEDCVKANPANAVKFKDVIEHLGG